MPQNNSSPTSTTALKPMRPFFIIWSGQAFSLLGSGLVQFALIWYLTTATGSAMVLAIAGIVGMLPQILLGPVAGALVDRWNRRLVMVVADSAIAAVTVLLALCFLFDWVPAWLIYFVMFIRSLGGTFHWPAMQASTPLLVPEKQLTRIAGMNQGLQGVANFVVPPLAALLVEWLPIQGILAIDVGTAIIALMPLLFIHVPNPTRQDLVGQVHENKPSVLTDLRTGLAFVWRWTGLLLMFGMGFLINIFLTPALILMPIMVTTTLGGGALALAWVQASWGVGTIVGGLLLGMWHFFNNRMITVLTGGLLLGVGVIAVGFTPTTLLSFLMVALGFSAIMNTVVLGVFVAIIQIIVPNAIQGRVFTLFTSINNGMVPLGLLLAAPIADSIGVQLWFILAGIVIIVICTIGFFVPAVLHLEAQGKQLVDAQEKETLARHKITERALA